MNQEKESSGMESRNLAVGVLSTTAVILLVGLAIIHTRPTPAQADGMTVARGDYLMTVGSGTQVDEELIFLIDVPEQKMIIYRFDAGRHQIDIVQGVNLAEMREATRSP